MLGLSNGVNPIRKGGAGRNGKTFYRVKAGRVCIDGPGSRKPRAMPGGLHMAGHRDLNYGRGLACFWESLLVNVSRLEFEYFTNVSKVREMGA